MSRQHVTGERHWYVLHTYSGYEDAVADALRQRIENLELQESIFSVLVPKEKKIKIKAGKRVTTEEKIFPGYVLVEMIVTDESWYVVRNTPNVTGFIGSGTIPTPISEEEMKQLFKTTEDSGATYQVDLTKDALVRIVNGPFKDHEGKVSEVDQEKGKVKVMVTIFGREVPVELDFLEVVKV